MSNNFWLWFVDKICSKQRITLPNVGTFSVVFTEQKKIQLIDTRSILTANQDDGEWTQTVDHVTETVLPRKIYIRFRTTGNLKKSVLEYLQEPSKVSKRCYTGDRNPVVSAFRWSKYVSNTNDISNLSQHRRLIWWYSQENNISVQRAAQIISSELQKVGDVLTTKGFIHLGDGFQIQIVGKPKHRMTSLQNNHRWRTRFVVPHEHLIASLSKIDLQ